jgi:hypothetical protein
MNDDRWHDAASKRHSTVGEALGVAAMCRRALSSSCGGGGMVFAGSVLTHFSQRYPRALTTAAAAAGAVAATAVASAGDEVAAGAGPRGASGASGGDGSDGDHHDGGRFLLAHDGLTVPLAPTALDALLAGGAARRVTARVDAAWQARGE